MQDLDDRLKQLRDLYAELPEMACEHPGRCANSCGPIDMSIAEHDRIVNLGVLIPTFTEEAAARWAADQPLHCPALNRKTLLCDVYEDRPLICRAWGVADSMPCPQGCRPTRMLDDLEMYELLLRSFQIGGHRNADTMPDLEGMIAMLKDEVIGPLMHRFLRGDRTVGAALEKAVRDYQRRTH